MRQGREKEMQEAFEASYLREMQDMARQQKEDALGAIEIAIYDALSECDCIKNNLLIAPVNVDNLYEHIFFAIDSIKKSIKELRELQELISRE